METFVSLVTSGSRQHARLFRRDDRWWAEDLGSRNGTLLNGRRLEEPSALENRDVLQLSASLLTVSELEDTPLSKRETTTGFPSGTILRPISDLMADSGVSHEPSATPAELRRYASRLELLNDVHRALSQPIQLQELLDLILGTRNYQRFRKMYSTNR